MTLAALGEPIIGSVGLIVPSSNRLTEPQFNQLAPAGLRFHVTRGRFAGAHHLELPELLPQVATTAELVADAGAGLIVFHCTGHSMIAGLAGERAILDAITAATGLPAISTATACRAAFQALGMRRIILASPYQEHINGWELRYLTEAGVDVLAERGMGLNEADEFALVTPAEWVDYVTEMANPEADGYFVSCTAIRAVEVIETLENRLGKPVVTSNQSVLWYCLRHFGDPRALPQLGQLMSKPLPVLDAVGGR